MVVINQGQNSTLYLTGTEKVTLTPPYYFLFNLVSRENRDVSASFLLTDTSSFPTRYNEFTITTAQAATLLVGEHKFTLYAQSSAVNTDPALADEAVEVGVAIVRAAS